MVTFEKFPWQLKHRDHLLLVDPIPVEDATVAAIAVGDCDLLSKALGENALLGRF